MDTDNKAFKRLLDEAVHFHGHLCGGQIIGVRMAMAGLREVGITDPQGSQRKDFIAFVEIDRCATDAIMTVTGLTPGKRSLKILDHGKMAATFLNLQTGRAVRIVAREDSRGKAEERSKAYMPELNKRDAYNKALLGMAEEELIEIHEVMVDLKPGDLPGPPVSAHVCTRCGETILDAREVVQQGRILCRTCASGSNYYRPLVKDTEPAIVS